jgi:hypothetical protein
MTECNPTRPIRLRERCQRPIKGLSSIVLSALLATQILIANAHAEPSPSAMTAASPKKDRVDKEKSRNSNAGRHNLGCWQYKLKAGLWKRTYVCR